MSIHCARRTLLVPILVAQLAMPGLAPASPPPPRVEPTVPAAPPGGAADPIATVAFALRHAWTPGARSAEGGLARAGLGSGRGTISLVPSPPRAAAPGEEDAEAPAEPDEPAEPELRAAESSLSARKRFWVWTGTAAIVGLFVARFAYDLSHDESPVPEPELPYFPNTP